MIKAQQAVYRRAKLHPVLWPRNARSGPDSKGEPFVKGSTALHYAANDGKLKLVRRLIEGGADPNASNACWFRSVLSWAANNARIETINFSWSREPVPILSMHYTPLPGAARLVGRERNGSMPRRSSC